MTFLELTRRVQTMCGLQGQIDSVDGQTGEYFKMVEYVRMAYDDIQSLRKDFKFKQATHEVTLTSTVNTIDGDLASEWKAVYYDNRKLSYMPYENYLERGSEEANQPCFWTVVPETHQIILNSLDDDYDILVRYIVQLDEFASSTSEPILPTAIHLLIAYTAARDFASYLGDPGLEDKYAFKADVKMGQMMRAQVPAKLMKKKRFIRTGRRAL